MQIGLTAELFCTYTLFGIYIYIYVVAVEYLLIHQNTAKRLKYTFCGGAGAAAVALLRDNLGYEKG